MVVLVVVRQDDVIKASIEMRVLTLFVVCKLRQFSSDSYEK